MRVEDRTQDAKDWVPPEGAELVLRLYVLNSEVYMHSECPAAQTVHLLLHAAQGIAADLADAERAAARAMELLVSRMQPPKSEGES